MREARRQASELPEYKALQNLTRNEPLNRRYAALFRKLNLPPAELATLKRLLLEKQGTREDVVASFNSEGVNIRENYETISEVMNTNLADIDRQIGDELGADVYDAYQQYEAETPHRSVVDKLSLRLSYTANPLTENQQSQLIQLLAANQLEAGTPQVPRSIGRQLARLLDTPTTSTLNQTTLDQARGLMTPDQYQSLEQLYQEQQASGKMTQIIRAQIEEATSDFH